MSDTADVIVIGGGIAGIGAAAMLSGDAKVIVLETEDAPGRHSTGRSAAIFIRNYGNAVLRSLNAASAPFLESPDILDLTSVLSPRGELLVAGEEDLPELEAYLDGAVGIERMTPDQAVELVPILRKELLVAAAYEPDAQDIDVDRLFQGYIRYLRHNGGTIATKASVEALSRDNGVWTITAGGKSYQAPIIINASGAWADVVAGLAGMSPIGIQPMRRTAAILPAPEIEGFDRWPLFAAASEDWYAKPEAGTLMVSPADEDPVDPHDAWADDMVLAEGLYRFEQAVDYPVTRVERSWAGLRSFAPDRSPVVGFDPRCDGFFWLAGQGGYGIQTAPALSKLAADLCLGRDSDLDAETVSALSPGRFLS